ncbi:hypothetical protein EV426DRAFT_699663 [Tirmania nivea]|nr:hypothetical protein EV426DRAFT_699663 [Tirmania nivea]
MPPLSKKRKADIELHFDSEEEDSELERGPGGADIDVDEELNILSKGYGTPYLMHLRLYQR